MLPPPPLLLLLSSGFPENLREIRDLSSKTDGICQRAVGGTTVVLEEEEGGGRWWVSG
jgi:hypothetical protein